MGESVFVDADSNIGNDLLELLITISLADYSFAGGGKVSSPLGDGPGGCGGETPVVLECSRDNPYSHVSGEYVMMS